MKPSYTRRAPIPLPFAVGWRNTRAEVVFEFGVTSLDHELTACPHAQGKRLMAGAHWWMLPKALVTYDGRGVINAVTCLACAIEATGE